jgi:tRNA-Thr(GGU) m(6)t(6)A37 methyltransferase TsaA
MLIDITPIGVIHSPFADKDNTPIQGAFTPDAKGRVEVYAEYADGLKDIESFSHILLLYLFDRAGEVRLVRPTFLDDEAHGVFASRHPCRPNRIGLTVVRLLSRSGNMLEVGGIDVLDQTPLVDIKPYVPRFDCWPDATEGWLVGREERPKPTGRE